jgi:probable HAF family extracellular repeat protein
LPTSRSPAQVRCLCGEVSSVSIVGEEFGSEGVSNVMTRLSILRFRRVFAIAFVGIAVVAATPVNADAPFFMGLGHLDGYEYASWASAVSADGQVVVGRSATETEGGVAFRWTAEEGLVPLGWLPGGDSSWAQGVSADGSVVVGYGKSYNTPEYDEFEAFKWTGDTGVISLGDLPGGKFDSRAYDVTADGEIVVGYGTTSYVVNLRHATRWIEGSPPEDLGGMPGVDIALSLSGATAVSPDGSVIVGWAWNEETRQEAIVYSEDDGMVGLGFLGGYGNTSLAWDVAVNTETVVVGRNRYPNGDYEAFRWTAATGMVGLGDLPGGSFSSVAEAVSADGNVIVGYGSGEPGGAFIWDELHGMRELKEVLTDEYGLDLAGWQRLITAYDVSADGLIVVGNGIHNDRMEAWIAGIPEPETLWLLLAGAVMLLHGRPGSISS